MTTITLDDELINQVIAKSHYKNAEEAVNKILSDYLQQTQEPLLFEQLRLNQNDADDELALLFERNKDTGRDISL